MTAQASVECVGYAAKYKLIALTIIVCLGLVGLSSSHAAGQVSTAYYLHASECSSFPSGNLTLDEQQPHGATCSILIEPGSNATVWATSPSSVPSLFPSGNWSVSLWSNTTGTMTQYNLTLAVVGPSGNLSQIGTGFTPVINSSIPTQYIVQLPVSVNATLNVGDSLTLRLLNQAENGNPTNPGFVFLDSAQTPSELTSPTSASNVTVQLQSSTAAAGITQMNSTTTQSNTTAYQIVNSSTQQLAQPTLTQQVTTLSHVTASTLQPSLITSTRHAFWSFGWVLAILGVGAGAALLLGAIAFISSGKAAQIIVHEGRYYCRKHRVALVNVYGALWCPFERKPLRP